MLDFQIGAHEFKYDACDFSTANHMYYIKHISKKKQHEHNIKIEAQDIKILEYKTFRNFHAGLYKLMRPTFKHDGSTL